MTDPITTLTASAKAMHQKSTTLAVQAIAQEINAGQLLDQNSMIRNNYYNVVLATV
jgi:hypothetical protein